MASRISKHEVPTLCSITVFLPMNEQQEEQVKAVGKALGILLTHEFLCQALVFAVIIIVITSE